MTSGQDGQAEPTTDNSTAPATRRSQELTIRLRSLRTGPWIEAGELAWKTIALKKAPPLPPQAPGKPFAFQTVFANVDKGKQRRLARALAPHWDKEVREDDILLRESLDEALTFFQLVELAIETGYITIDDVRDTARKELIRLLWAPATQKYVRDYDYLAVGFLAKRVNLDIGYDVHPPSVDEGAEGRFALFLSQHYLWYGEDIEGWLGFLDDYQILDEEEDDQTVVYDFLRADRHDEESDESILELIAGAEQFLALLTDLYGSLAKSERPRYGLFYLYWMAKMLGYDSDASGFYRGEEQVDWAEEISSSKRLKKLYQMLGENAKRELNDPRAPARAYHAEIKRQVKCVRSWFSETLTLIGSGKSAGRKRKTKKRRRA